MPAIKINPIEQHFEKGILGIGVLILLYTLFAYTISSPTSVLIEMKQAKPGEAYKIVLEKAKALEAKASQQKWPKITIPKSASATEEFKLVGLPNVKPLPAIVRFNKELKNPEIAIFDIKKKYDIPKVIKPENLVFVQGRSTIDLESDAELQEFFNTSDSKLDVSWVTVAARIDLEQQRKYLKDLPEQLEKEPIFIRVELQRAEIDKSGNIGKWETVRVPYGNQLIIPPDKPLKVNSMSELRKIRNDLFSQTEAFEIAALQPMFPPVIAGKEWTEPMLPGEKPKTVKAKAKRSTPQPAKQPRRKPGMGLGGPGAAFGQGAMGIPGEAGGRGIGGRRGGRARGPMGGVPGAGERGGGKGTRRTRGARTSRKRAGRAVVPPPAGVMGPAGFGEMPPGMYAPGMEGMPMPQGKFGEPGIAGVPKRRTTVQKAAKLFDKTDKTFKMWAYDITPKPGKTYVYRTRVVLYNPFAGYKPYLKNPKYNLLVGIAGPWSEQTKPVTIEKDIYLFVSDVTDDQKGARITVYKWHKGWLCKESFNVYPGDEIGYPKETRLYQEQSDGFHELREEVDFRTGAILLKVEPNGKVLVREPLGKTGEFDLRKEQATVITFRDKDGILVKQDNSNVLFSRNYKICKSARKEQLMKLRKSTVIRYRKK